MKKSKILFSIFSLVLLIVLSSFEVKKADDLNSVLSQEVSISVPDLAVENSGYAVQALKNYPTPYAVSFATEKVKDFYAMNGTVMLRTSGAASYCFVECFKNGSCWDCFDHDCNKTRICNNQ